jgi:Di-haem oxidoreductase, putative peroxidase
MSSRHDTQRGMNTVPDQSPRRGGSAARVRHAGAGRATGLGSNGPRTTKWVSIFVALWGLRMHPRHMHDLRSLSLEDAIERHSGEAAHVRRRFRGLERDEKQALIAFFELAVTIQVRNGATFVAPSVWETATARMRSGRRRALDAALESAAAGRRSSARWASRSRRSDPRQRSATSMYRSQVWSAGRTS